MIRLIGILGVTAVLVAGAGLIGLVGTASAAKEPNPLITVDCGSDGMFTVLGNSGNGAFTPAKIANGGGVLIPVAFSNQVSTFTDNDGNVFTEPEPDASHPAPANKHLMSCSFSVSGSSPEGTFSFSGDVVAFMVPPRR
jgi:hypothetical protein